MRTIFEKSYSLVEAAAASAVIVFLLLCGCSLDPIGMLYEEVKGPFTEQVGPFLKITHNPGPDWYPSWSADGSHIVYSAWGFEDKTQGQMTINTLPVAGGISTRVSPVFARTDYNYYPLWIESDAMIAYVSFRGLSFSSPLEPSLTIVETSNIKKFTENLLDMNSPIDMSISPDGSGVAFSDFVTTHLINGGTSELEDSIVWNRFESFSSNMTAIWYAEIPLTGESRRLDGTDGAFGLCWSPGSDTLAFSRDGSIYLIAAEGGTAEELFEGEDPAWSPDGSRIACVIGGNIFVYRLTDGERTQITTDGGIDPAWSPDGEKLAFSWARGGNFDIYIVNLADVTPPR